MRRSEFPTALLLRGVSRSFDLSVRALPRPLREPVGLAYLLARTSDTVADTTGPPAAQRLALLDRLQQAIEHPADDHPVAQALGDFARHVADPREQALLMNGQGGLDALVALPAADQALIRQVLAAIIEGQRWDLATLDQGQTGVQTQAEIERYTWLVAGSVGEFWTRLCALHLSNWHSGSQADMLQWAARYGKGLQKLNILRDAGRDLRAGRCYWPAEALAPRGLDRAQLCAAVATGDRNVLSRMAPLLHTWCQETQDLLHDGLRYSLALRSRRLRLASVLPCLIGIRTLALLRQAGPQTLLQHVKLPRAQVRQLLWGLLLSGVSPRHLQSSWDQAQGQPRGQSARIGQ